MILITSDTHCYYGCVNQQIEHVESQGISVSSVIHLGDFGIYRDKLYDFFIRKKNRFLRPVYFIEGNHEDFQGLEAITKKYAEYFTHLPRGTAHEIDGYRFLCLGGAEYMDAMITQKGSEIKDSDIDSCLDIPGDAADVVLSHDCPRDIGVPNTPGLEHYGSPGIKRSAELVSHFAPRLWLFGHHHKWFEHKDGETAYYGLPSVWKGFGLLDSDYRYQVVKHLIPYPDDRSWLDKLLGKMRIINPDLPTD